MNSGFPLNKNGRVWLNRKGEQVDIDDVVRQIDDAIGGDLCALPTLAVGELVLMKERDDLKQALALAQCEAEQCRETCNENYSNLWEEKERFRACNIQSAENFLAEKRESLRLRDELAALRAFIRTSTTSEDAGEFVLSAIRMVEKWDEED